MRQAKGKLAKKLSRLNARIKSWDDTQAGGRSRNLNFNPASYKKPGSQKTHA